MVETCTALGIAPLTKEEFTAEDRRIYMEMMNRRHGIHPGSYSARKRSDMMSLFGTY